MSKRNTLTPPYSVEKAYFKVKMDWATIWATFHKISATFLSNHLVALAALAKS